jgi:hypothetical protein
VFKDRVIEEGPWNVEGEANNMWEKMTTCIRKVATDRGVVRIFVRARQIFFTISIDQNNKNYNVRGRQK